MSDDFYDVLITGLYKNKGSKAECGKYRDISLFSLSSKIIVHIIFSGVVNVSEWNLPES